MVGNFEKIYPIVYHLILSILTNCYFIFHLTTMNTTLFRSLLTTLLFSVAGVLLAQKPGFVTGSVRDMFSEEGLAQVKVSLFRSDSLLVDSTRTELQKKGIQANDWAYWEEKDKKQASLFRLKVPDEGRYRLVLTCEGYDAVERDLEVSFRRRNRYYDVGEIWMGKARQQLGEAVARGTKIKMFYKGDTLVYNADAFHLEEGSMLEDLVKRLPGVELRKGRLYANGRFVESILLSGKDFFKGNPQEALKNLPSYVVDKLKFYSKEGESSKTMGTDVGDKSYVMDVKLKREYLSTWLLRPEVGLGTKERWSYWGYGMRFDDRQNFTLNADLNNINNERDVAGEEQVMWMNFGQGIYRYKGVKAAYSFEPNDRLKFSTYGVFKWQHHHTLNGQKQERFLDQGSMFHLADQDKTRRNHRFQGNVALSLRPQKGQHYQFDYTLKYNDQREDLLERLATLSADPDVRIGRNALDSLQKTPTRFADLGFLNHLRRLESLEQEEELTHSGKASASFGKAPHLLTLKASFDHEHRTQKQYRHNDLRYYNTPTAPVDYRNTFNDDSERKYQFATKADYLWKYLQGESADGQMASYVEFQRHYKGNENPYYRLERLAGWGSGSSEALGTLPSMSGWQQSTIDAENSRHSTLHENLGRVGATWTHRLRLPNRTWMNFSASLPVDRHVRHLYYHRNSVVYTPEHTATLFSPELVWKWNLSRDDRNGERTQLVLNYLSESSAPDMLNLLGIRDAADPLNIFLGNPTLQNTRTQTLKATYRNVWRKSGILWNFYGDYKQLSHAIAMGSVYDRSTGVRTYRPENIEGNYEWNGMSGLQLALDSAKNWDFELRVNYNYLHSRDLNSDAAHLSAQPSTVRNHTWAAGASLSNWGEKFGGYADLSAEWRRAYSSRPGFLPISLREYGFSAYVYFPLPGKVQCQPNVYVYRKEGFTDASLNRTIFQADLTLRKSFFKDRLSLALNVKDVFNSRSWDRAIVDAQGRTETYTRLFLPRHVMLYVGYKFRVAPTKKK